MTPSQQITDPLLSRGLANLMQQFNDSGRAVEVSEVLPLPQDKHSPSFTVRLHFPGAQAASPAGSAENFRFAFQLETVGTQARARFIKAPFQNQLNNLADPAEAGQFAAAVEKNIADTGLIALPQLRAA